MRQGDRNFGSWQFLDVVIAVMWKFREEGPELFKLAVWIRSLRERGISCLARRRMEPW